MKRSIHGWTKLPKSFEFDAESLRLTLLSTKGVGIMVGKILVAWAPPGQQKVVIPDIPEGAKLSFEYDGDASWLEPQGLAVPWPDSEPGFVRIDRREGIDSSLEAMLLGAERRMAAKSRETSERLQRDVDGMRRELALVKKAREEHERVGGASSLVPDDPLIETPAEPPATK